CPGGRWFGEDCTDPCPETCKGGVCDALTGDCKGNLTFQCSDGRYGARCTQTCPYTCKNLQCDITDGYCTG
ncbi:unnamed protein product, partial [Candidula unifasciata]